jgi:uncharacterized RDD family membrane protein YckC
MGRGIAQVRFLDQTQFGRSLARMPFDKPWDSDPIKPLAISINEDVTEPERRAESAPVAAPSNLPLAWLVDAFVLSAFSSAVIYVAGRACRTRYWLDFIRDTSPQLAALVALLAVTYSFVFVALGGRTPGLALCGLRVQTVKGRDPTPFHAFVRAAVSPLSALGLFGFTLALFDPRRQTLHDKLCRCVVRID